MTISWEISELPNGLRVVTTPLATAQSVSVSLFTGTGSRAEERGSQGLAHFLEHMIFKGSERRPTAMAIAEAVEGAGGVLNAYTTKEITCFWNHLPFEKLDLAMDVLADMVLHPVLDAQEIASRYGSFFGNLLYDPWYDLEPALKDFDIDIKDLQKVWGRLGSTCLSPMPWETPLPMPDP